ncbi:MAG: sigma 54-interacting transcriptional regulator [Pseudomonadota bacterium]
MSGLEFDQYWWRVINTMNDALLIVSNTGIILTVNQSFEEMTGYSATEVIGKPCTLLECNACEKVINPVGGMWCKLFDLGNPGIRRCRCEILKKDGTYLSALKNASVLRDNAGTVLGAVETLTDISELTRLDEKVRTLSRQLGTDQTRHGIVGESSGIQKVLDIIEKAAKSDAPVIITGESGTGKELVAHAIHDMGNRRNGPFVQLNCAALNESILESELFGHVKGSFTGAYRDRKGRFETANGGDLFLDEIGDIPMAIQIKLLRVLETKQFEHVGDDQPVTVNVRIITATNKNLIELIGEKKFREDLYFRINVIPIHLPPLRERTDDIPLLVNAFVKQLSTMTEKDIHGLTKEALQYLMAYRWPGNIRELKSALEYAFAIAENGPLTADHLPPYVLTGRPAVWGLDTQKSPQASSERQALIDALKQTAGNQSQAARILGVNRVTVWNRMRKYGIDLKRELSV